LSGQLYYITVFFKISVRLCFAVDLLFFSFFSAGS